MSTTVGVVVIGHGNSATAMLAAARLILGSAGDVLADVVAIDAGRGKTPALKQKIVHEIEAVDQGAGVLLLVDLLGASPCNCGQDEAREHGRRAVVLAGLNLAMVLKLATVDRSGRTLSQVAEAVADTGRRAVAIKGAVPQAREKSG